MAVHALQALLPDCLHVLGPDHPETLVPSSLATGGGATVVGVSGQRDVIGDDPLIDGMRISVRVRRDFTVTDAERLVVAARRAYTEVHPHAGDEDATAQVTCAADALFVILERDGLLGDETDRLLAGHASDGLAADGWRAQVIVNEPDPLPLHHCLRTDDVFALPRDTTP